MALALTHAQQRREATYRSLSSVGILRTYHGRSLTRLGTPEALRLLAWIETDAATKTAEGWVFVGDNAIRELAILVARALHVGGEPVCVMGLLQFQEMLAAERRYLDERLAKADALFLLRAGPDDNPPEEIFTRRELRMIEERLMRWMEDGRRLCLHMALPLSRNWYTAEFTNALRANCQTITGGAV